MAEVQPGGQGWKRRFFVLWTGQAASLFSSAVIQMAIIWHLTETTGSAAVLSAAMLMGFLPQALLGPFIGSLVDRYDRKRIMIVADLSIAASALVLAASAFMGRLPVWLIMLVLCARSMGTGFHQPSLQAVTPLIVPGESLTRCAGYSQTLESVSMLLSPAAAALLYGIWNIGMIFLLDVAGALAGVFTLLVTRVPALVKKETEKAPALIRETKEGLAVLRSEKGLTSLLVIGALYAVIYMPISTLYPLISMNYFRGTFREAGIVEIAFSAGMLLGSLVLGRLGGRINKVAAIAKSIAVMGIGLAVTGLLPPGGLWIFVGLSAAMGFTTPFYWGVQTALFQTRIMPEYLGRVLSLSASVVMIAMPLGLILSGAFAETIGVEKWFLISGIAAVALGVACASLPSLRALRRETQAR